MTDFLEFKEAEPQELWEKLVNALSQEGIIQTNDIKQAFLARGRHLMVPESDRLRRLRLAGMDSAYDIGYNQSISQPRMVAIMTELLQPKSGEKALDVGLGSGWQAVVLRELVGKEGKVYGMERIGDLVGVTRERFVRLGIDDIVVIHGDALNEAQVPDERFDMITCAAGCEVAPSFWTSKLKEGGRMVYPKQVGMIKAGKFHYQGEEQDAGEAEDGPVHQLCITRKSGVDLVDEFHGQLCRYVPLTEGTV